MESPLHLLRERLIKKEYNQPVPLLADQLKFDFYFRYPSAEQYHGKVGMIFHAEIEWSPKEQGVFLTIQSRAVELPRGDIMEDFCQVLYREAKIFVRSMIVHADGEPADDWILDGHLNLLPHRRVLVPSFSMCIPFEHDESAEALLSELEQQLNYGALFMHIAHPVFASAAQVGRRLTSAQRMLLLLTVHGESQVLRVDEDHGRDEPPPVYFPRGVYGGCITNRSH